MEPIGSAFWFQLEISGKEDYLESRGIIPEKNKVEQYYMKERIKIILAFFLLTVFLTLPLIAGARNGCCDRVPFSSVRLSYYLDDSDVETDNVSPDTPTYFSLGEAILAFGLIFTVFQLRKHKWDIILRIRNSWQSNFFWILESIGLLLILIRALLSHINISFLPPLLNAPLFYEITAYLFFIISPLFLIYFSNKTKDLFNEKTSRKFYEVMVQEISRTNDEVTNAALMVLLSNFDIICKSIHGQKSDTETRQSAEAILDVVLSDASVVKILTTKRLDALQYIFATIKKHEVNQRNSGIGIPKIVQGLFYDRESFFYRQLDREGLALSSNIYESIFDSPMMLANFDLFEYPTLSYSMRRELDTVGIRVLIESLSRAIKTYLKTGNVPARHINNGLSYLSEVFGDLCLKISVEERRGVDTKYALKDEWWALNNIADFLGHDYLFLGYQEQLDQRITETEKTASEADFFSDSTINAGIAGAIFKAFEQLSYIENTTDVYHIVLNLLQGMMYEDELKEGYREPFEKIMWEKIAENVVRRFYPAVLKIYLEFIGFCLVSDRDQNQGWIGGQTERMRRLLYVDLKPLIDAGAEMANKEKMKDALLSKSMDYKDGKFTYKSGFGRGEEKEILPPSEGSRSALEGVDMESRSLLL